MASNLKETHIDKILELNVLIETNRHTEQSDRLKNQPRTLLVGIAGLLLFLTIFSFMTFYFSKAEIILPVITGLGGMLFGALGEYGYGSRHKAKRDDMMP
jgi:hypothetical protein